MNQHHLNLAPLLTQNEFSFNTHPVRTHQRQSPANLSEAQKCRRRGVLLTNLGWQKLQNRQVLTNAAGDHYTYEMLGEKTILSPRTVAKVISRKTGVDLRTLRIFFNAFELLLSINDYIDAKEVATKGNRHLRDRAQPALTLVRAKVPQASLAHSRNSEPEKPKQQSLLITVCQGNESLQSCNLLSFNTNSALVSSQDFHLSAIVTQAASEALRQGKSTVKRYITSSGILEVSIEVIPIYKVRH